MSNEEVKVEDTAVEVVETVEEVIERPFELRRLKDKDLWPMLAIVTKVFPNDLSGIFVQLMTKEKKVEDLGAMVVLRLAMAVIKNIQLVQEELYELLSDMSGMTPEEIQESEFGTTPLMIMDIANNAKNASFFKVLSKLL